MCPSEEPRTIFVILLRLVVPGQDWPPGLATRHVEHLSRHYEAGRIIASGPLDPWQGGIILAKATSREDVEAMFDDDPLQAEGVMEYTIHELVVSRHAPGFDSLLEPGAPTGVIVRSLPPHVLEQLPAI